MLGILHGRARFVGDVDEKTNNPIFAVSNQTVELFLVQENWNSCADEAENTETAVGIRSSANEYYLLDQCPGPRIAIDPNMVNETSIKRQFSNNSITQP